MLLTHSERISRVETTLFNKKKTEQHIWQNGYEHHFYPLNHVYGKEDRHPYKPSPSGIKFHSDPAPVRLIIGPYGSGKSTICINEIIRMARKMPPCNDGIRHSRAVFIRNTYGELQDTTLKTWENWFDDLGDVYERTKPPYRELKFKDEKGEIILEVMFLALDREDHIKKLKSAEYTFAYLNEACELPEAVLNHIKMRVGRYPAIINCPTPFEGRVVMDTNPPDTDHWMYKLFEENKPASYTIIHQPPGLLKQADGKYITNPDAENLQYLEKDYYVKKADGATDEFKRVYCMGEYGTVIHGKRVYEGYNDDLHSMEDIEPIKGLPISLGLDFGLTPAIIICQQDAKGRIYVIDEIVSEDIDLDSLLTDRVDAFLASKYAGFKITPAVGDPAGAATAASIASDCYQTLLKHGIPGEPAFSNDPIVRINAVKHFLNRNIEGKPAFILSRRGCPTLRKGFLGHYCYERVRTGNEDRYKDAPKKNRYSHIQDALQYICLKFKGPALDNKGSNDDHENFGEGWA